VSAPFDRMAARYDELRVTESTPVLLDITIEEGLGQARRLLDVGCGTGRFSAMAAERLGVRLWGVDQSEEMLARARARGVPRAGWRRASADDLPFRDGWFDAVLMRLVVHLFGEARPAAFAEAHRVLGPGGRLFLWTFATEHFPGFYLTPYLPSLPAVDLARFPEPEALVTELEQAGFAHVRVRAHEQRMPVERADAAERVRGRYISTLHLLDPEEVNAAADRLEAEAAAGLPPLEAVQRWRLLVAERAG
jgi:SAM-dependent methyltransferase